MVDGEEKKRNEKNEWLCDEARPNAVTEILKTCKHFLDRGVYLLFILLLIETSSLLISLQDILISEELLLVLFCAIAAILRFQFE